MTGFVGQALHTEAINRGMGVVVAVRQVVPGLPEDVLQVGIGDSFELKNTQFLQDIDTVIHCAARTPVIRDCADNPLEEFRKVNTQGTLNLARQAVDAGVKRFVFISSIHVLGYKNSKPYSEFDSPKPTGAYAISKHEAEQGLLDLCKKTEMEVVIIRSPLVYGPDAPGRIGSLIKWINVGIPMPLGSVNNKKSFIGLDNLVSFIILCADYPKSPNAANEVFLISDDYDISTTELIYKVREAFNKKTLLFPFPVVLMKYVAGLIGKRDAADRLFGSLQVDCSKAKGLLGWRPVTSIDEQLRKIAGRS